MMGAVLGQLVLASADLGPFLPWLRHRAGDGPAAVVATAAERLSDRDAVVAGLVDPLHDAGWTVRLVDPTAGKTDALGDAALIAVAGGDPFHLIDGLRRSGADRAISDGFAAGVPYLGMSAGAMVAGPSLAPVTLTSPFAAPDGLDLRGLALTRTLVLPHHDLPGRAARHFEALRRYGREHHLVCLRDGDWVVDENDRVVHQADGRRRRAATADDDATVAEVYLDAARTAWSSFMGERRMAGLDSPPARWRARIGELQALGTFTVGEDDDGVAAFAATRPTLDADLDPSIGELALLYASSRTWGTGLAARLHEQALLDLVAAGHDEAVVWTEERNARALAFYRREGWRPDGATRARTFLDQPIVEARHRVVLGDAICRD